jgi:succinate dehydrogenase flavin-adding protein (antitoxin of CptAB toxin-antitoxin module)
LLTAPDQDVYAWLRGAVAVPDAHDNPVFRGLQSFCGRRDPDWKT